MLLRLAGLLIRIFATSLIAHRLGWMGPEGSSWRDPEVSCLTGSWVALDPEDEWAWLWL